MEIDQRQKDVCPPGEAGQSGQDEHILVAHGISESNFDYPPTTSGGARFNRASNILQRGTFLCQPPKSRSYEAIAAFTWWTP
jgi:hypothetical protein